jgi:hypothetical protein
MHLDLIVAQPQADHLATGERVATSTPGPPVGPAAPDTWPARREMPLPMK